MADTDVASEPVFRSNKRRKVFRKRADSDHAEEGALTGERAGEGPQELEAIDQAEEDEANVTRSQKRGGARKLGITFSSTGGGRTAQQQATEETALVPFTQDAEQELHNDRFVKPTGREVVTEDKHMYVEPISKNRKKAQH